MAGTAAVSALVPGRRWWDPLGDPWCGGSGEFMARKWDHHCEYVWGMNKKMLNHDELLLNPVGTNLMTIGSFMCIETWDTVIDVY